MLFSGPDTMSIFAANNSPFWNTEFSLPKLEESYLMYNVRLSLIESVESNIFTIVADTPDVNPTILRFSNWSIYDLTVTPRYSLLISTHAKLLLYDVLPGITFAPSLNICWPNFAIWSCNIDCKPVNSLAWTGSPGLNRTLW